MDIGWNDIWELFHFAILAGIVAGLVCPVIGCFLLVRRTGFYGITLPQFAACGVAFGFTMLPWWVAHIGIADLDLQTAMEDTHAAMNYHLSWAGLFTFGGLFILLLMRRGGGVETAQVAASFAVANAATILFAHMSPTGEIFVHDLLRGEILTVGLHEFETLAVILGLVAFLVFVFHRDILIVSYDRETSRVLGKNVMRIEALLISIIGLSVTVGTLTVGPVVIFGLLVIPPVAARRVARSMSSFYWIASGVGLISVLGGFWGSFTFDLPLGPCVVLASSLSLLPALLFDRSGNLRWT